VVVLVVCVGDEAALELDDLLDGELEVRILLLLRASAREEMREAEGTERRSWRTPKGPM